MKIYAPVENATGVWCSVYFKNGVGETKNPRLIEWFKEHGYKVEGDIVLQQPSHIGLEIPDLEDEVHIVEGNVEPDFESMTPNELRDWMKANGLGSKIKNIRNKEKLIEIIRG